MPGARYLLLVNPSAGAGRAMKRLPAIEAAMREHGLSFRRVETTGIEHACREAAAAAAAGEIPVVCSGDGLIGKVGGVLAGGTTPLGVVPGGRGNDFARVVGIPTEPAEAVAILAADHRRRIDVGEANGERFLCIASFGFDSDANRIANETKVVRGPLVYAYAALRALWKWKPANFVVTVDGEERRVRGYAVAVANSKAYGGGMFVAPDAVLDDGELDVIITGDGPKRAFITGLPDVFKGTHIDRPEVSTARGAVVEVSADRPFDVYADGDRLTELPATIRVLPNALELIAPAPEGAAGVTPPDGGP
ncbi:MAG: diacylglycerol kinase family protein [Solirubrobacterales bacterium]